MILFYWEVCVGSALCIFIGFGRDWLGRRPVVLIKFGYFVIMNDTERDYWS